MVTEVGKPHVVHHDENDVGALGGDGTRLGKRLFDCAPQRSIFAAAEDVSLLTFEELVALPPPCPPRESRSVAGATGAETRALMPERDALMGTETFVSLTFPATDHGELYAVGAGAAGVRVGEREHKMPALVTLHNPTGALAPLATCLGAERPFNVFMTNDAATLLADAPRAKPASRAVSTMPTTPPAGPDSSASLPWNLSAAVRPPEDIMNVSLGLAAERSLGCADTMPSSPATRCT